MLASTILTEWGAIWSLTQVATVLGYPSMAKQLAAIFELTRRNESEIEIGIGSVLPEDGDSSELLGDLRNPGPLTTVGLDIRNILIGLGEPEAEDVYISVPELHSAGCQQDTCCVWKYIAQEMDNLFRGESGRCTRYARMAIRLGFHDAGTWSKRYDSGGADGSICLTDEYLEPENKGLEDIVPFMRDWHTRYNDQHGYPVSMADLIQFAANVATVVCPLGPRVRTFVGRIDNVVPNNSTLLPSATANADDLVHLFRDKTIGPHGLVALLGAHTVSQQRFQNPERANDPQDTTPGIWDMNFYTETLDGASAPERVYMFPSDVAISQHVDTVDEWLKFQEFDGQSHWNRDYAAEYIRVSLLGVNNINNLTECTKALPVAVKEFRNPDQASLDFFLGTDEHSSLFQTMAQELAGGREISFVPDS